MPYNIKTSDAPGKIGARATMISELIRRFNGIDNIKGNILLMPAKYVENGKIKDDSEVGIFDRKGFPIHKTICFDRNKEYVDVNNNLKGIHPVNIWAELKKFKEEISYRDKRKGKIPNLFGCSELYSKTISGVWLDLVQGVISEKSTILEFFHHAQNWRHPHFIGVTVSVGKRATIKDPKEIIPYLIRSSKLLKKYFKSYQCSPLGIPYIGGTSKKACAMQMLTFTKGL